MSFAQTEFSMAKSVLDFFSIKAAYDNLSRLPFGNYLFSKMIGLVVPYTGSIGPRVEKVEPGFSRIHMYDYRCVRNHLNSIHAAALMNLGEAASGLALNYELPENSKAILKDLKMEYFKKARGSLHAEGRCDVPRTNERKEYVATAEIYDASDTLVAKATATWLVGPKV
jgi:acyl-coenzyme A thioesterase PaaI-like protein